MNTPPAVFTNEDRWQRDDVGLQRSVEQQRLIGQWVAQRREGLAVASREPSDGLQIHSEPDAARRQAPVKTVALELLMTA